MARQLYQNLYLVFCYYVSWTALTKCDKEIILKEPKKGEQWLWQSDSPWTSHGSPPVYKKCTIGTPERYYIRTPFIPLPPLVRTIEVAIVFSIKNCSVDVDPGAPCSETFDLYKYEQNKSLSKVEPELFTDKVKTIRAGPEGLITGNPADATITERYKDVITITVKSAGVYLAFFDRSVCQALFSFETSYRICSRAGTNLAVFDKTSVPADGSLSAIANGTCVNSSVLSLNASTPQAVCNSNGDWVSKSNLSCFCEAGYQPNTKLDQCIECPLSTFKAAVGNEECSNCSANSSPNKNRTECECNKNFFKLPGEKNCTEIPSAPEGLSTGFVNDSAVILIWQEPNNKGGRDDVFYNIKCEVWFLDRWIACLSGVVYKPTNVGLKQESVTVFNLRIFMKYKFTVIAKNGVSYLQMEQPAASRMKEVTTHESIPGKVDNIEVTWLTSETVNIRWKLDRNQRNGIILYYEVKYYQEGDKAHALVKNSTDTNVTISGLSSEKTYVFEVRAKTKVGFGAAVSVSPADPTLVQTGETNSLAIIVGGCSAAVFVFLIIGCAALYLRKKSPSRYVSSMETIEFIPTAGSRLYIDPGEYGDLFVALRTFAREIERELLTLEKVIGGGEFGDVYQGMLKLDGQKSEKVAIKMLKPGATRKNKDDFLTEASIMGQFKHDNVLEMKGVISTSSPMMIVLEFMENGALNNFLKQHDGQLQPLELLGMAQDVAKGMSYLSDMNFIHRDLSARNILVSESRVCKVADFGLSRELAEDDPNSEYLTQGGKIPVRWTAIEAFKYRKFSPASDVWSYGVLMWEIMSFGERPYWQWDNYQVMSRVELGYRLPAPMDCPKVIHTMMMECWREDRTKRPKFDDLVQLLEQLISSPDLLSDEMADQINCKRRSVNFEEIHNVDEWLERINLGVYKTNFNEAGLVNLGHVIDIDDNALKVIGVDVIGHRNKIKKSVKSMKDFLNENAEEGEI